MIRKGICRGVWIMTSVFDGKGAWMILQPRDRSGVRRTPPHQVGVDVL